MIKKLTKRKIIILKKEIIIFNVDILNSFLKNFQGSEKFREKIVRVKSSAPFVRG